VVRNSYEKKWPVCVRTKTTAAQNVSREYGRKIIEFHTYVINMRKKLCFEIGQLGNLDEIPLMLNVPSNKTVDVNTFRPSLVLVPSSLLHQLS
jgi:hypothetical protein